LPSTLDASAVLALLNGVSIGELAKLSQKFEA
jgi:hypothetical protein